MNHDQNQGEDMKKRQLALNAALATMVAAGLAAGQVSAADAADLRCVALFSMMAGEMRGSAYRCL